MPTCSSPSAYVQPIYYILNNHLYLGVVKYGDQLWPGEQEKIIAQELWDRAHEILKNNDPYDHANCKYEIIAPLKGILRCGHCDCPMIPTYAGTKQQKRYYYYLCQKDKARLESTCPIRRIGSGDAETAVQAQVKKLLQSPLIVTRVAEATGRKPNEIWNDFSEDFWRALQPGEANRLYTLLLESVTIRENTLELELKTGNLQSLTEEMKHA